MSQVDSSHAGHADASNCHVARDAQASEFSEISFNSTHTGDHDADSTAALQSEASTSNLLGTGTQGPSLTWSAKQHSAQPSSSSIKHVNTPSMSHKGKQPSNDHYVDLEPHKLGTIDETAAASASSYVDQNTYNSSANGYVHDDTGRLDQERGRFDSPDIREAPYSPSTYPPTSEEDSEAKRVQQNLERWAAEERQRRKAHRTSKTVSSRNLTVSGGGSLSHRLSMLRAAGFNGNANNLGAGPSSERLADDLSANFNAAHSGSFAGARNLDPTERRGSATSSTGGAARGLHRPASPSSFDSAQSGSIMSDDHRPNRKLPPIGSRVTSADHDRHASGGSLTSSHDSNHRTNDNARDPFRDPSEGANPDVSTRLPPNRSSLKPTPTASRPIVTVGRASSIQRRALEANFNSSKGKGKGKGRSMPTIVATDTEAEEGDEDYGRLEHARDGDNPFASTEDQQQRTRTASTTIHQGGLDEEVAMEIAGRNKGLQANGDLGEGKLRTDSQVRPPPARTSTSSSKFRELGITEDDDWIETVRRSIGKDRSSKHMRIAQHTQSGDEREGTRKPWWSELLCGCQRDFDDDEQVSCSHAVSLIPQTNPHLFLTCFPFHLYRHQAGRTNPME